MTDHQPDGVAPAVQLALQSVATQGADEAALNTLAGSEVLMPVPGDVAVEEAPEPGQVSLPVVEQEDGTQLVPVFTTQSRLEQALPQIHNHRRIVLGTLARGWPSEELSLVIDAGAPEELALTAKGVKELLARSG